MGGKAHRRARYEGSSVPKAYAWRLSVPEVPEVNVAVAIAEDTFLKGRRLMMAIQLNDHPTVKDFWQKAACGDLTETTTKGFHCKSVTNG